MPEHRVVGAYLGNMAEPVLRFEMTRCGKEDWSLSLVVMYRNKVWDPPQVRVGVNDLLKLKQIVDTALKEARVICGNE